MLAAGSSATKWYKNVATGEITNDEAIIAIWTEEDADIVPMSEKVPDSHVVVSFNPDDDQAAITIVEIDIATGLRIPHPSVPLRQLKGVVGPFDADDDMSPPPLVRQ